MGVSIVDKIWTCYCGAWNAHYREDCGACGKPKPIDNKHE